MSDDHGLFKRLHTLIADGFSRFEDSFWTPMVERAIHVVFALADHPNEIATEILKDVVERFKQSQGAGMTSSKMQFLSLGLHNVSLYRCRIRRRSLGTFTGSDWTMRLANVYQFGCRRGKWYSAFEFFLSLIGRRFASLEDVIAPWPCVSSVIAVPRTETTDATERRISSEAAYQCPTNPTGSITTELRRNWTQEKAACQDPTFEGIYGEGDGDSNGRSR